MSTQLILQKFRLADAAIIYWYKKFQKLTVSKLTLQAQCFYLLISLFQVLEKSPEFLNTSRKSTEEGVWKHSKRTWKLTPYYENSRKIQERNYINIQHFATVNAENTPINIVNRLYFTNWSITTWHLIEQL